MAITGTYIIPAGEAVSAELCSLLGLQLSETRPSADGYVLVEPVSVSGAYARVPHRDGFEGGKAVMKYSLEVFHSSAAETRLPGQRVYAFENPDPDANLWALAYAHAKIQPVFTGWEDC